MGLSWSILYKLGPLLPEPLSPLPPAKADSWARVSSIVASLFLEEGAGEGEGSREEEEGRRLCSVVRLRSSWRER